MKEQEITLLHEYNIAYLNYKRKVCSKCSKEIMIKNDCGLLVGGSQPSCMKMERAIKQRKAYKKAHKRMVELISNEIKRMVNEK